MQIALQARATDVARMAMVSRRFGYAAPGAPSLMEEVLRQRACAAFRRAAAIFHASWTESACDHRLRVLLSAFERSMRWRRADNDVASLGPMVLRFEDTRLCANPMRLSIKTVEADGSEIIFLCTMATPLGKLMAALCDRRGWTGAEQAAARFYYCGLLLKWDDTPASLSMHTNAEFVLVDVIVRAEPEDDW